jgi:hypothetical protein
VGGQRHALAALPPGKTRYPLYRRLGGLQGRSGRLPNISPPQGFDPWTVEPVWSRYTDHAIPGPFVACLELSIYWQDNTGLRPLTGLKQVQNLASVMRLRIHTSFNCLLSVQDHHICKKIACVYRQLFVITLWCYILECSNTNYQMMVCFPQRSSVSSVRAEKPQRRISRQLNLGHHHHFFHLQPPPICVAFCHRDTYVSQFPGWWDYQVVEIP